MVVLSTLLLIVFVDVILVVGQSECFTPHSLKSLQSARSTVHYAIEEESPSGTTIGHGIGNDSGFVERLEASDRTTVVDSLRYRFLTQPPSYLQLDERSGMMSISERIDREEICDKTKDVNSIGVQSATADNSCQIRVDIAVQPMSYFQIFKVYITILDINDNDPVFSSNDTRRIEIVESAPTGNRFPLPVATDRDSARFGVQRYAFASTMTRPEALFELSNERNPDGSIDVKLVLVRSLDREIQSEYRLTIVAYDGGVPAVRSASCDVTVVVLDVNDNRPIFDRNKYESSVVENAPIGTTIMRLRATDADVGFNGAVRYQLSSGNVGNLFAVNDVTGDVTVAGPLDYERAIVHHLVVCAIDGNGSSGSDVTLSSDVTVQIRVVDINDNAPTVTFNTLTASGTNVAAVAEDATPGTFVSHVIITDPDAASNGQTHCIIQTTGDVINKAPFSLEQMFETEYQIITTTILDRESVSRYSVTLLCHDAGSLPLSTTVQLYIDVTDVNDNSPMFHSSTGRHDGMTSDGVTYIAELLENNFIGVFVVHVNATDMDSGQNGRVTYLLTDDPDTSDYKGIVGRRRMGGAYDVAGDMIDRDVCDDKFAVDLSSGIVTAKSSLDFEQQSVYKCRILAIDGGTPPRTGEARLCVNVIDVNDERPVFVKNSYIFHVVENLPAGSYIGTVSASDADSSPYNRFTFCVLSAGSLSDAFQIDVVTGTLSTTRPLDRETQDIYHLIVVAKDNQSPDVLTSTASVTVYIGDVNDNPPVFVSHVSPEDVTSHHNKSSSPVVTIEVSNQISRGSVITKMTAIDADVNRNAQISYRLQSCEPSDTLCHFNIDSHTGLLLLTDKLTRTDINATYQLTVTATDAGTPPLSSAIQITLRIVEGGLSLLDGSPNQMTSPLSSYDARSHHILVSYGISGLIAVITLSVITITVFALVLVAIVCLVRRRRHRRDFSDKSSSPFNYKPTASRTSMDKYNCRIEELKATVNHREVGVAGNNSKGFVRTLESSPRLTSQLSGRVVLVTDSCPLPYNNSPNEIIHSHSCETVDCRMTTFRQSPSPSHVTNNYWTTNGGRSVARS